MGCVNPKNRQTHPKKPKKVGWVGWLGEYGFKKWKPIKNNGFWVKPDPYPINQLTQ